MHRQNNKNDKNIILRKIILGSHMIAIAIVLSQISKAIGLNNFRMPIIYVPFFNISCLPLVFLGIYLGWRFALFSIFTYLFLDFIISKAHIGSLHLYQSLGFDKNFNEILWLAINSCFGVMLPHLTYILIGFLYRKDLSHLKNNKKNNFRLLKCFLVITLIQAFLRTVNGLLDYLPGIIEKIKKYDIILNNKVKNFAIVFCLNLAPIITTNLLLVICLIVFHMRFKNTYQINFYSF